jgi:small subunit ribosomal protein S21
MAHRRDNQHRSYNNNDRGNERQSRKPNIKGTRPSHVVVIPRPNEHPERAIKRFIKKCKKSEIADDFRKHQYYEKPSTKRRKAKLRRQAVLKKLREKQDNQKT